MRLTLITSAILGAALAISTGILVLVKELSLQLRSPSWRRKHTAWMLLVGCELVSLGDRIYNQTPGRWIGLLYSSLFLLAVVTLADSYRLMLKDLGQLYIRLTDVGLEPEKIDQVLLKEDTLSS